MSTGSPDFPSRGYPLQPHAIHQGLEQARGLAEAIYALDANYPNCQ